MFHKDMTAENSHTIGYVQSSDPGAIGAGKVWVDTSGGAGAWRIKIRNAANSAWEDPESASTAAHTHVEADITDLGSYADAVHTHVEADITDLGSYADAAHTHVEADITDLSHDAVSIQGDDVYGSISPSDGDVLTWDDANSRWDAAAPAPSGGSTEFDIPHNSALDDGLLKVHCHGIQMSGDSSAETLTIHCGSFIRAFEHGSSSAAVSPPEVCMSRDGGVTWTAWSSNVWIPSVDFDLSVDGVGLFEILVAATDGVSIALTNTFVVIAESSALTAPSYP